jgi:hypothetical protein
MKFPLSALVAGMNRRNLQNPGTNEVPQNAEL